MASNAPGLPDVVVVGGGIAGCSAALFLARQGARVTLIERSFIAAHASGKAFGVLMPRVLRTTEDPTDALLEYSLKLHDPNESDGVGIDDPRARWPKASVLLARTDEQAGQFRQLYRSGVELNGDVRWLEHGELTHIEARISPDVRGGLYLGDAIEISPPDFSRALWQQAAKAGAKLVNEDVTAVSVEDGGGVSVSTGSAQYSAGSAVVAAGPWTSAVLETAGVLVPVEPLKGQIVRLQAPGPPMRASLWWDGNYAGSRPDGLTWCGTTEERVGFDDEPTAAAREEIMGSAKEVLPFLADATLVRQTACLRPLTPDGLPVLGAVPGSEQIVVASGAGRNGLLLGPAMGRVAAGVATGDAAPLDISVFSPVRFTG